MGLEVKCGAGFAQGLCRARPVAAAGLQQWESRRVLLSWAPWPWEAACLAQISPGSRVDLSPEVGALAVRPDDHRQQRA